MLDELLLWWKRRNCKHEWRAGVIGRRIWTLGVPVRFCEECDKTETLTVEQFYAQFGRMPF